MYVKSYDIQERAASIGRKWLLGGQINTVVPRMSSPAVTMKAAIHWENHYDYTNEESRFFEKSTITWKKTGTGMWAPQDDMNLNLSELDGENGTSGDSKTKKSDDEGVNRDIYCCMALTKTVGVYSGSFLKMIPEVFDITHKIKKKLSKDFVPVPKFPDGYIVEVVDRRLDVALVLTAENYAVWEKKQLKINDTDKTILESKRTSKTLDKDSDKNNNNTIVVNLLGTLLCKPRRHLIRGMWRDPKSTLSPQPFDLLRNDDTDLTTFPKDGEFNGSFEYGKQIVSESGVKINFTKIDDSNTEYKVDGTGVNQFGSFSINGTAKPASNHTGEYSIKLRKIYIAKPTAPRAPGERGGRGQDRGGGRGGSNHHQSAGRGRGGGRGGGGRGPDGGTSHLNLPPSATVPMNRTTEKGVAAPQREKQTDIYLAESIQQLRRHGFVDGNKSPITGNHMFYPNLVRVKKYYEFVRLVKKPDETKPTSFYCFLCKKEYIFSNGCSNQLKRHDDNCLQFHKSERELLFDSKQSYGNEFVSINDRNAVLSVILEETTKEEPDAPFVVGTGGNRRNLHKRRRITKHNG